MPSYRRIRNIKLVEEDWLIKGRTQRTIDRIKAPTIADMSIDFRPDPPSRGHAACSNGRQLRTKVRASRNN